MKRHLSLALALAAAVAVGVGLAQSSTSRAAQAQQGGSPIERLEKLEAQVADLKAQVAKLEGAKPVAAKPQPVAKPDSAPVKELGQQMEAVIGYLAAVAQSAQRLEQALMESEQKGFTYGINPDSRTVLLAGFNQLTTTLQTDVPAAKPSAGEKAPAGSAPR